VRSTADKAGWSETSESSNMANSSSMANSIVAWLIVAEAMYFKKGSFLN